ncbi:MAG TPA: hemolysin family protein [Bryobacteraceae bacterium]|nr:hemolysin family protein [Bryobacteraceae bacterium]
MDSNLGYNLLIMFFIVGLNAFFAASEVALVSSRPSRLRALAEEGHVGAHAALSLLANSERLLSVVQVGVTLCSLALGVVGEKPLEEQFHAWLQPLMSTPVLQKVLTVAAAVPAYMLMTYMHVVIGEVVPKNVAIEKRDRLAVIVAPVILIFFRIVEPFVIVLEKSAAVVSKAIGVRGSQAGGHSVEELKYILSSSQREGELEGFVEQAMQRLLEMQEYLTREIMVPRNHVISVPVEASLDHMLRVANEHQYSRLPIYDGRPEHLVGYVHVKDLVRVWEERRIATERRRPVRPLDLRRIMRPLQVIPESKPVVQLLDEFRKSHTHIAMVVDEFGTAMGVVTLEDVLEQVFGEIEDEHDLRRPQVHQTAAVLHVEGTIPIRDLELQYGIELPVEAGYETLAGFLLYRFGYIPTHGNHVDEKGRRFVVEEMDRNRIARVRVERVEAPEAVSPAES